MKFYLTGGAVRDELLGQEVRDRDYIILDADKDELIKMKFEPVGKDFEVYLHPKTKDEYTLAIDNDLYKELERRDLSVNSIAKDIETGEFYDPFKGIKDIKNKVLKHTSKYFSDDPIRILRVARFKSQYPEFTIHKDTLELCRELSVNKQTFKSIVGERFLLEFKKSLALSSPTTFFELLREWGTLDLFFWELSSIYNPSEQDCWLHTMLTLEKSCELSSDFSVRFASLVHGLGSDMAIKDICNRFKIDNYTKNLSVVVGENYQKVHKVFELKAEGILELLISFNALREGTLFEDGLLCCYADAIARNGVESKDYPQKKILFKVADELKRTSYSDLIEKYDGKKLGEMIKQSRVRMIKVLLNNSMEYLK